MHGKAAKAIAVQGKQLRAVPHQLNLDGWYVTGKTRLRTHLRLTIEMVSPVFPHDCSQTGEPSGLDKPRKFGSKTTRLRDLPLHGEYVDLEAIRPRLQCRRCKKVATVHPGLNDGREIDPRRLALGRDIDPSHRMTTRLIRYIQTEAASRTFTEVAKEVGIPEATIRAIFKENRGPANANMMITAPRVLGIDDKHINGKLGTVFVDLENKILLDMYETNKSDALQPFLRCLDKPQRIEVVCQDMSSAYLSFCKDNLPWAHVVIDKFHVVMKANAAVDKARIRFKKTLRSKGEKRELAGLRKAFLRRAPITDNTRFLLRSWMNRATQLRATWMAKEKFYGFYSQTSAEHANDFYEEWLAELDDVTLKDFRQLRSCMDGHRENILNYFRVSALSDDRSVTNGYLEALNLQIQRMKQKAPRYDFETLRQKLLATYGPEATERAKFKRRGLKAGGRKRRRKPTKPDTAFKLKKFAPLASRKWSANQPDDMFPETIRQPLQTRSSIVRPQPTAKVASEKQILAVSEAAERNESVGTSPSDRPQVAPATAPIEVQPEPSTSPPHPSNRLETPEQQMLELRCPLAAPSPPTRSRARRTRGARKSKPASASPVANQQTLELGDAERVGDSADAPGKESGLVSLGAPTRIGH